MSKSASELAFEILTSEDDGRVCKDIPESACREQPQNFLAHVFSLSLTKAADGLVDPKLILSWLLVNSGSPAVFLGLLVPIREAGALLPQLFTAAYLRALPYRKWAWALGSLIQGCCALFMGFSAYYLQGTPLAISILLLVAILALARSLCSVTYKDVLGKTVDKSRRGTATGTASSVAAILVICYALILALDLFDRMAVVLVGFLLAGIFWLLAASLFTQLTEEKGATEGGGNPFKVAKENFKYLKTDKQLRLFILTRALLIATALAPPFMIALSSSETGSSFAGLGLLVFASAGASLSSSYFWGRLADKSSRKVLLFSAITAAIVLFVTLFVAQTGLLGSTWVLPILIFGLMIAYQGVRLGRSTHLVDMTDADRRAVYTALSNTLIGILLLLGSIFGLMAQYFGEASVVMCFAVLCCLAAISAYRLNEVQRD